MKLFSDTCPDCQGTGEKHDEKDTWKCIMCSGNGKTLTTLSWVLSGLVFFLIVVFIITLIAYFEAKIRLFFSTIGDFLHSIYLSLNEFWQLFIQVLGIGIGVVAVIGGIIYIAISLDEMES